MGWLDPGNWLQNTVNSVGNALNGGVSPGDALGSVGDFLSSNSIGDAIGGLFGGGGGGGPRLPTGQELDPNAFSYGQPAWDPYRVATPNGPRDVYPQSDQGLFAAPQYGQVDNSILQQLIQSLAGAAPKAPDLSQINAPYDQATASANTNATTQGKSIDAATQQAKDSLAQLMAGANAQTAQDRSQMVADQAGQQNTLQAAMAPYAGASGAQGGAVGARLAAQNAQLAQMQAAQAAQQSSANSARNAYTDSSMNGTVLQGQSAHNLLNQNLAGLLDKIGISKSQAQASANNNFNSATSRYQSMLAQLMGKANSFINGQQQTGSQMGADDLYQLGMSSDPRAQTTADLASTILRGGQMGVGGGKYTNVPAARNMSDAMQMLGQMKANGKYNSADYNTASQLIQEHYNPNKQHPRDIMSRLAQYMGGL